MKGDPLTDPLAAHDAGWVEEQKKRADRQAERQRTRDKTNGKTTWTSPDPEYVRERLSLDFWHERELPPLDPVLGELVTTTSRVMVVGPTGLGKTNLLMAAGIAMADGRDFLHWRGCGRPRRVLYIDGEMSRRLFKTRLADVERRHGGRPATFFAFSREDFEDMPPLDTEAGQEYIDSIIKALGGVDVVLFDNIQALTIGELREPESWRKVLPWVRSLTKRNIGQIWVHHTGLAEDHAYGDQTREWQLDTVIMMETVERPEAAIAFAMKCKKARERTPDNRADFAPAILILANDSWISEPDSTATKSKRTQRDRAFELLEDLINKNGEIPPANTNIPSNTLCVHEDSWRRRCEAGMISEGSDEAMVRAIRRVQKGHLDAGRIGKHKPWVWIVRNKTKLRRECA